MDDGPDLADSHRLLTLAAKFRDKRYRDGYVAAHTRSVLARQMRNFRGDLSQAEFAEKIGKQKTMVARLENPAYGGWSVRTMLEIARNLNVAVIARFVDFPTFLNFTDDMSDDALRPQEYNEIRTNNIVASLSGTTTHYDFGSTYSTGGPTMEAMAPAIPSADVFVGTNQAVMTMVIPGTIRLTNTYLGTVDQTIGWPSSGVVFGQSTFPARQPASLLPAGMLRTQAAIRRLSDLAISQKNQIETLQSELSLLRQAPSSSRPVQQSGSILPFPVRKQTFGSPLDALRVDAA
jgi:hypothetical protein